MRSPFDLTDSYSDYLILCLSLYIDRSHGPIIDNLSKSPASIALGFKAAATTSSTSTLLSRNRASNPRSSAGTPATSPHHSSVCLRDAFFSLSLTADAIKAANKLPTAHPRPTSIAATGTIQSRPCAYRPAEYPSLRTWTSAIVRARYPNPHRSEKALSARSPLTAWVYRMRSLEWLDPLAVDRSDRSLGSVSRDVSISNSGSWTRPYVTAW
jgi:hypothetical protein